MGQLLFQSCFETDRIIILIEEWVFFLQFHCIEWNFRNSLKFLIKEKKTNEQFIFVSRFLSNYWPQLLKTDVFRFRIWEEYDTELDDCIKFSIDCCYNLFQSFIWIVVKAVFIGICWAILLNLFVVAINIMHFNIANSYAD